MRYQENPADVGRCGCGRREYCDSSHALSEAQWQAVLAKEREAAKDKELFAGRAENGYEES
jgi:hypothetical protein